MQSTDTHEDVHWVFWLEQPHLMYVLPQPVLKDEYTDSVHYFW